MELRKWRPTFKCIYVIPEVHGNVKSLEIIFNRILPLRKFTNQEDILVMLGDFIDKYEDGCKVINALIAIKKEYGDRAIFLRGNHEQLLINSLNGSKDDFTIWIDQGGLETIKGYLKASNISSAPTSIPQNRLNDIIPKEHIEFLKSLPVVSKLDQYVFFHGSFDHNKSIEENDENNLMFDYTASKYCKQQLKNNDIPVFKDDYIYVGAHNFGSKVPFLYSKYFMLGGTAPKKVCVFELNSMSACACAYGKERPYKLNFKYSE